MESPAFSFNFRVKIYNDRDSMGKAAADDAGAYMRKLLQIKDEINCIFAAAPSQNEFLKYLAMQDIEWSRVNAFHMDEYIGLKKGDERLFASFLKANIFDKVRFKKVYYMEINEASIDEGIREYEELLAEHPVDIVFMGIGENGHIAFNDPHVADFRDNKTIKVVDLDEKCRMQQVHDGCFPSLEEVPKYAVTLTIPALMRATKIFCIVPSATKAEAVKLTVLGEVTEKCPATILRKHSDATLYLDREAGKYLIQEVE